MIKREINKVHSLGLGSIYDDEEINAVVKILRECVTDNRVISQSTPEITEFEEKAAEYLGVKHAVAVSSCGTGLDIATQAIGIKDGDEVITTAITYQATAVCVLKAGGRPVPADVDPKTINIKLEDVERRITPKTKAIYTMHYGGRPVDIDGFNDLAKKYGLAIVEDAAHAMGTEYKGKKVGSYDFMSIFSFQSGKNISTLGEGGLITTNDDNLAEKARLLRSFAITTRKGYEKQKQEYPVHPLTKDVIDVCSNYRMTPFQAAVGITQLKKLDYLIDRRNQVAEKMDAVLGNIKGLTLCNQKVEDVKSTYHLYPVLFEPDIVGINREDFVKTLASEFGVMPNLHYPLWYRYSIFQDRGYKWNDCPVAEELVDRKLLTLPIHPKFGDEEVEFMGKAIEKAIKKFSK